MDGKEDGLDQLYMHSWIDSQWISSTWKKKGVFKNQKDYQESQLVNWLSYR